MTTTLLPPAARSTMDAVREGLADIRDRVSDIEALPDWEKLSMPNWDKVAENTQGLIDRATGRQRRRRAWPFVALGVLGVIGLAIGVTMFMMNRSTSMEPLAEDLESDAEQPWTPVKTGAGSKGSRSKASDSTSGTFPESDPMPSPMSPSIGG